MSWTELLLIAAAIVTALVAGIVLLTRHLQKKEPYASVLRLRSREKLRFFRYIATDGRVPNVVKVIPFLLALYLAMPFDIIPDFIPVLGYIDDVGVIVIALSLMVKWTPPDTVVAITERAKANQDTGTIV